MNTSSTPINEPPAMMPEATGKVYSSAAFGERRPIQAPAGLADAAVLALAVEVAVQAIALLHRVGSAAPARVAQLLVGGRIAVVVDAVARFVFGGAVGHTPHRALDAGAAAAPASRAR